MREKSDTKKMPSATHATGMNTRPKKRKMGIRKCQNCGEKKKEKLRTLYNMNWRMVMCPSCAVHSMKNGWSYKKMFVMK